MRASGTAPPDRGAPRSRTGQLTALTTPAPMAFAHSEAHARLERDGATELDGDVCPTAGVEKRASKASVPGTAVAPK